jgi:hypothetical protein
MLNVILKSHIMYVNQAVKSFINAALECTSHYKDRDKQAYKPLPVEWTSDTHASHPLLLGPADSSRSQGAYCNGLDRLEQT